MYYKDNTFFHFFQIFLEENWGEEEGFFGGVKEGSFLGVKELSFIL